MNRLVRALAGLAALVAVVLAWARWRAHSEPPRPVAVVAESAAVEPRRAVLWFASADAESLVREIRELAPSAELRGRVAPLVSALAAGPRETGVGVLPAGTGLEHVFLDDQGQLTLDLSRATRADFRGGAHTEELAIASILRTVADNLPEVRSVRILCAGGPLASLGGHVPLHLPLDPEEWR